MNRALAPTLPLKVALSAQAPPADDEVLTVDGLLEESGKAALYAVDHGDGGTQEIAYHMEAIRLAIFALVIAVRESSRQSVAPVAEGSSSERQR